MPTLLPPTFKLRYTAYELGLVYMPEANHVDVVVLALAFPILLPQLLNQEESRARILSIYIS